MYIEEHKRELKLQGKLSTFKSTRWKKNAEFAMDQPTRKSAFTCLSISKPRGASKPYVAMQEGFSIASIWCLVTTGGPILARDSVEAAHDLYISSLAKGIETAIPALSAW